ncbi:MAG: hypothetical protein NZ700_08995 [Gemmataceae bacterium]|nr:hypothetical protein [Gemmataceae bacterium]MDW8267384.1 hypothetical protein [Gemmataceae bacterium]
MTTCNALRTNVSSERKVTMKRIRLVTLVASIAIVWGLQTATALAETPMPEPGAPLEEITDPSLLPDSRRDEWLRATPEERALIAQEIGEEGARRFAQAKNWRPIFDGKGCSYPHGLDQVYEAADGTIHVIEAKGGAGRLGHGYGHPQGSPEWAVEAAKRTLESSKACPKQKQAARAVLEAAAKGKMEVHVVQTTHTLGKPTAILRQRTSKVTRAARKMARAFLDALAKSAANSADDVARGVAKSAVSQTNGATGNLLKNAAKFGAVAGAAAELGMRGYEVYETERRYAAGEISQQEREVSHAKNAAGVAGGLAGAWAGFEVGAMGGGALGSCVAPGPGTVIGGVVGGAVGGVAGYFGGEAAAQAAAEWTVNKIHATGETIGGAISRAWSWLTDW